MKDFYAIPETKEVALANLNEMNEMQSTRRAGKMLAKGIERYGMTPNNKRDYQNLVISWIGKLAGIGNPNEVTRLFDEMGYTVGSVEWKGSYFVSGITKS